MLFDLATTTILMLLGVAEIEKKQFNYTKAI